MPNILCEFDACRFNEEGRCEHSGEVTLVEVIPKGQGSLLDCKTFEWREDDEG